MISYQNSVRTRHADEVFLDQQTVSLDNDTDEER